MINKRKVRKYKQSNRRNKAIRKKTKCQKNVKSLWFFGYIEFGFLLSTLANSSFFTRKKMFVLTVPCGY